MAAINQPVDFWRTGVAIWTLAAEAQAVVTYRTLGMLGFWKVQDRENERMCSEKGPAFAEAGIAAGQAVMAGKTPDKVAEAWMKPLQLQVSSNRKRLAKSGPRLG